MLLLFIIYHIKKKPTQENKNTPSTILSTEQQQRIDGANILILLGLVSPEPHPSPPQKLGFYFDPKRPDVIYSSIDPSRKEYKQAIRTTDKVVKRMYEEEIKGIIAFPNSSHSNELQKFIVQNMIPISREYNSKQIHKIVNIILQIQKHPNKIAKIWEDEQQEINNKDLEQFEKTQQHIIEALKPFPTNHPLNEIYELLTDETNNPSLQETIHLFKNMKILISQHNNKNKFNTILAQIFKKHYFQRNFR